MIMKNLITLILLAATFSLAGDMQEELFNLANKQYEAGNFDSAAILYSQIIESGTHDAKVYYNLGNIRFRQKKLGEAILNFEKARWLDASDNDIIANIEYTRSLTKDKIVPAEHSMFFRVILAVHDFINIQTQSVIIIIILFILAFCLTLYFSLDVKYRSFIFTIAMVMFIILLVTLPSFMAKRLDREKGESAIVLSSQVNVLNEPNGTEVLFTVHEGAKFKIIRKIDSFAFASLENGLAGWIDINEIGFIEIRQ
jgi:tetratricopeptide (TPR) repeat protein